MKYYKYLPTIIGCAGLIIYLLKFFYVSSYINVGTSFILFAVGVFISMFLGYKGWSDDMFAGWLGLLLNLLPLGLLGFIYLNATFK